MNKPRFYSFRGFGWRLVVVTLGAGVFMQIPVAAQMVNQGEPHNPRIQQIEKYELTHIKIAVPFTFAAGGDIIETHPISQLTDPDVRGVFKIIQGADFSFGNDETSIVNFREMTDHAGGIQGPASVAADIKAMGFKMVQRASNHGTDMGIDVMLKGDKLLEQAGLVFSGSGRNLEEAREAHYYDGPKGRVGLVSMFASQSGRIWDPGTPPGYSAGQMASYQLGITGGLAGENVIRLTPYHIVTPEEFESLQKIETANSDYAAKLLKEEGPLNTTSARPSPKALPDRLNLFGVRYKVGTTIGGISYTMNPDDLRLILRSIRNGKEQSDFMVVSIHTHETASSLRLEYLQQTPPDFLVKLAHLAIDNGADMFIGTGVHILRPVEIYKGRPIFYGLESFAEQFYGTPVTPDRYIAWGLNPFTTEVTKTEINWDAWGELGIANHPGLNDTGKPNDMNIMESMVPLCRFAGGRLVQILLYPIQFGYGLPLSQKGIPRLARGEVAQRILEREQKMSKPFGTIINIVNGVGVINVAQVQQK